MIIRGNPRKMNEYDFYKLNDKEFESLSIDLLSKVEDRRIERFKPGKDFGVDGRFFSHNGLEVIIQCKHWVKSGLSALLNHLRKIEVDKVRQLKPERYLFVTSIELSRHNKRIIRKIFYPFILAESDIYGKEDLNDLLSLYPDIEIKHYNLWISSTNILTTILNAAIIGRSCYKIDQIKNFSSLYVRTNNHENALQKLESLHSIIITGEPGIGKTTLADHLCLYYIIKGFEFFFIEDSISEAESVYKRKNRQIFYFDDFLGRNYLSALNRHEDSHVINFIKRVGSDNFKRFILTSRTTILNQGKRLSDLFEIENINRNEYELNIKSLSHFDKARILYNHIWFSELEELYIEELYKNKRYKSIIKHRNYNPRLISFITDSQKVCDISHKNYWTYIENTLSNPSDIWGHVYDNQLDENARVIVILVVFNGKEIEESRLKEAFLYLSNEGNADSPKYGISDFYSGVKLAIGALINRKIKDDSAFVSYDLFNPAVGDYIVKRFSEDRNKLCIIFESLDTNDSLENIASLLQSDAVQRHIMDNVVNHLIYNCISKKISHKTTKYIIDLIKLSINKIEPNSKQRELLKKWLINIKYNDLYSDDYFTLADILTWSLTAGIISSDDYDFDQYLNFALNDSAEHNAFISLSALFERLGHRYFDRHSKKFKELIIEYWEEMIDHNISEDGVLDGYFYEEEEEAAFESLYDYVETNFSEYIIKFNKEDINSICEYCDVTQHIINNIDNAAHEPDDFDRYSDAGYSSISEDAAIDDLFERTER
jgi:adenylate kinase family enzyme